MEDEHEMMKKYMASCISRVKEELDYLIYFGMKKKDLSFLTDPSLSK